MNRQKFAELTSGLGALVLGIGLGALLSSWLGGASVPMAAARLFAHAFGMWDVHRLEARSAIHHPRWVVALYVLCWVLLLGVALLPLWGRIAGVIPA